MLEYGREVEGHREGEDDCDVEEGPARREPHVRRLGPGKVAVQREVPLHGGRLRAGGGLTRLFTYLLTCGVIVLLTPYLGVVLPNPSPLTAYLISKDPNIDSNPMRLRDSLIGCVISL